MRLDRVCAAMNGWLLALVIGLMVLDFTVLVVKALDAAPLPPPAQIGDAGPAPAPAAP
jgi:hypothetical protein